MEYIYTMNRVTKRVAQGDILKDISLSFFPGARIGVLGLNGSGKSTLLRIIAGLDPEFEGEARPAPGIRIGYLPQEPHLDLSKNVRGNVEAAITGIKTLLDRFNAVSMRFMEPMSDDEMNNLLSEQGQLQNGIDAVSGWDIDRKLELYADALRLPPWDADVASLSGGEKRRVALCCLLLSFSDCDPDAPMHDSNTDRNLLLLDEPTNHLDAESVAWLEHFLKNFKGTIIAITHDRYFLDNVAQWILELDRGRGIPYEGNYSLWLEQKEKRLKIEAKQEDAFQKMMREELEWVRSNAKGRRAKSKSRLEQYEELSSRESQKRNETLALYIPPGPRLGDLVIDVTDVKKTFGDKLLFENLNFLVPKGAIVGVIGPNGAGKTTLFKLLVGEENADEGTIRIGDTVQLAYVDQSRDSLDGSKTVWQEVSDGLDLITVGAFSTPSRAYLGRFNFKGQDQQKYVKDLSGGERNRLHLAKLLKSGGNVLLLDEPTNDLDVETLRALEEALLAYPGCAIITSHDRWFLDRIATHILAFEGESELTFFTGNYQEYEAYRKKLLGDVAPKRIHYKKLD